MSESLKGKAINSIVWSGVERFSVQGMQFVLMLILARLLSPSDYGIMGMLAVFLAIAQSIIDGGFANALIRKLNRSEVDFSTVFYFNILIGLTLTILLYFSAPLISSFYKMPELEAITKAISIVLLIKSCAVVPLTKLVIELNFKTQTKASFISVVIGGFFGIIAALKGFGVWALVIQAIVNAFINTFLLLLLTKWKPLFVFSKVSFNSMFSYGSKLMISSLLDVVYRNIYPIIIGKKFDSATLGYYSRADQFTQLPSANITGIIQRVTFPLFSQVQDDNERLRSMYIRILRLTAFIVFPLMIGLAALSSPIILFLLTEKWVYVIILLRILCFSQMWYPVHALNLNLLQVKGYSGIFLKLELIKKTIGIILLFVTVPFGVVAMCIGSVVSSLISLVLNTYYTGKIVNLGFFVQMKALLPAIVYSISMGALVYLITLVFNSFILQILIGFVIGITYYLLISYITKSKDLYEIVLLITSKFNNNGK